MSYTTQLSEEEGRRRNMSEVQWTSKNGGISTTSRSGTVTINMTPHWQHMYGKQDWTQCQTSTGQSSRLQHRTWKVGKPVICAWQRNFLYQRPSKTPSIWINGRSWHWNAAISGVSFSYHPGRGACNNVFLGVGRERGGDWEDILIHLNNNSEKWKKCKK